MTMRLLRSLPVITCCFRGAGAVGRLGERGEEVSLSRQQKEDGNYWTRFLLQDRMSMPDTTPSSCPDEDKPLNLIIIGNSYTGGTSVGFSCRREQDPVRPDDLPRPECQFRGIPGNVRGFYQDPPEPYPSQFDRAPDVETLLDPSQPYSPLNNNHRGDVPSKMKIYAEYLCSGGTGNTFEYLQNSQSVLTTRSHAGQANRNPQNGTLLLLDGNTSATNPPYDVVLIQPQSTEYLNGATDTRVEALMELTKPRSAASPSVRFILQQTWPRRESTEYNQICTTGTGDSEKKGMIEEIDKTLAEFSQNSQLRSFEVAPTGSAFVEFGKLACGPGILSSDGCSFDPTFDCPIWFGDEMNRTSLYHEAFGETGTHQSEEIGAWLSAAVLYGVIQSKDYPCYMSESDLKDIVPTIPDGDLADIPSGQSIPFLISEATRLALEDRFGSDVVTECNAA